MSEEITINGLKILLEDTLRGINESRRLEAEKNTYGEVLKSVICSEDPLAELKGWLLAKAKGKLEFHEQEVGILKAVADIRAFIRKLDDEEIDRFFD